MPWIVRHARYRDRLSPYIDGELTPREARSLEAHLSACESCRRELAGLRTTVMALREMPEVDAPRSFALTPAQAARPAARLVAAQGLVTGVRIAGAAMAAALAIVLVIDRADIGGENGGQSASRQEAASLAMPSGEAELHITSGDMDLDSKRAAAGGNTDAVAPASPGASPGLNYPATGADTAGPGVSATSAPLPLTGGGVGGTDGAADSAAEGTPPPAEAADESTSDKTAEAPLPSGEAAARDANLYQEPSGLPIETPPALAAATAAEQSDDGGGLSTIGLLEIALAALLGLTIGGGVVLPLFRKKEVS